MTVVPASPPNQDLTTFLATSRGPMRKAWNLDCIQPVWT
jgi:hypothetical protein